MKDWFKGNIVVNTSLSIIKEAFENHDNHFQKAVLSMPGMTKAEVLESGTDYVTIRTNEGLMKRTKIKKTSEENELLVEFEENYDGGKVVEVTSQYIFKFTSLNDQVNVECTIRLLKTKGFLGFIYKKLSSKSIGKATLNSYKKVFSN